MKFMQELTLLKNRNKLVLVYKDTELTNMQTLGRYFGKETRVVAYYIHISFYYSI